MYGPILILPFSAFKSWFALMYFFIGFLFMIFPFLFFVKHFLIDFLLSAAKYICIFCIVCVCKACEYVCVCVSVCVCIHYENKKSIGSFSVC